MGAGAGGCGAVEESCGVGVAWAGRVSRQVGGAVDAEAVDAIGSGEGSHVGVLRELDGAVHEASPNGRGRDGSGKFYVRVVVVSDPDDADEIGRVGCKPRIMRCAGFASSGGGEASLADGGAVAEVHHSFKEGLCKVGRAGVHHLAGFRGEVGYDVAFGVANAGEKPGVDVDAAICKDGVGSSHIERRGVVGTE